MHIFGDYNRDGDSYRSPWSNEFFPAIDDGFKPPDSLRELELTANRVFDAYRHLYFEGGVSSVYFWELDDTAFAGAFLVKKSEFRCVCVEDMIKGSLLLWGWGVL